MDEHAALIEGIAEDIAAGRRPPPTSAEVEQHAFALPDAGELSIGQAAELFGILPTTIRFYEDSGLIEIARRANGHRRFDRRALGELLFIHGMRLSGMSVKDIARLRTLLGRDVTPVGVDDFSATHRSLATGDEPAPLRASDIAEAARLLDEHAQDVRLQIARLQIALAVTTHKKEHLIGEDR